MRILLNTLPFIKYYCLLNELRIMFTINACCGKRGVTLEYEVIKIEQYSRGNEDYYRERLRTCRLPDEFYILNCQELDRENKSVFLMIGMFSQKWFRTKKSRIIGYGIVNDVFDFPKEHQEYLDQVYKIPTDILQQYNIVISDFMISKKERVKSYGTKLANHILELYANKQISLFADGDGQWFWIKMGFSTIDENNRVYVKCH